MKAIDVLKNKKICNKFTCRTCGKKFYRYNKPRKGRVLAFDIKRKNAVNCSKECSAKYSSQRWKRDMKK